jgi:hypothetical protein
MSTITIAPKKNRHELAAAGPIATMAGRTSAADHWITVAPESTSSAPRRARLVDVRVASLNG